MNEQNECLNHCDHLYLENECITCILEKKNTRLRTDSDRIRNFSCKYFLSVNGDRKGICKKCFINTFGATNAFLNQIIQNRQFSVSTIIENDQRGRDAPKNKWSPEVLDGVVQHI